MSSFQIQVTKQHIEQYAELSQDKNPLHLDEIYAREAGCFGPIAHGMLTMAKVVNLVTNEYLQPLEWIKSYTFTFLAPVYVGDVVEIEVIQQEEGYRVRGQSGGQLVLKGVLFVNRFV